MYYWNSINIHKIILIGISRIDDRISLRNDGCWGWVGAGGDYREGYGIG